MRFEKVPLPILGKDASRSQRKDKVPITDQKAKAHPTRIKQQGKGKAYGPERRRLISSEQ
jgi:hypothetical protein